MRTIVMLFMILVLALFGVTACGEKVESQAVTLRAQDIKFDTNTLTLKAGQPVELTYINEGSIDHAFSIPGLVEEQKVRPGQTTVFTFTPKNAGQFKYVCVMPGHELAGMVGTLVVEQ